MRRMVIAFSVAFLAGAAHADWMVVASEDFEGTFPQSGWECRDDDGFSNGEYYWNDTSYTCWDGWRSGWCAGGGFHGGGLTPGSSYYPNYCNSWLLTPWLDFSDADNAKVTFYYWLESESWCDYLEVWVDDGYGPQWEWDQSGYYGYWQQTELWLGHYAGNSSVQIQFRFTSDGSVQDNGAFIDGIQVEKETYWQPGGPVAVIRVDPRYPDPGEMVFFDASDSHHPDWDRYIASYEWDFEYDGMNFDVDSSDEWTSWSYPERRPYTVALRVTDDQGATDMATLEIFVGDEDEWVVCGQAPRDSFGGTVLAALFLIGGAAALGRRLASPT